MHFCINYLQCFISEEILTNQKLSWTEVSRKQGVNISEKVAMRNLVTIIISWKLLL